MKRYRNILWLLPVAAGIAACSSAVSETKHPVKEPEAQTVEVTQVQSLQPRKQLVLPGELKPWNRVNLHAKVKGFVRDLRVDRGSLVKKGQVLAQLDAPEILSELSQAKAQLLAQEAALTEHASRYRASRLTYQRLLQTSRTEGAVSLNEIDQAQARMAADSALVAAAHSTIEAARSNFRAKSELKQYLTLTAPFDGMIIERNISPGALVGAGESNRPLFVLEDSHTLRLTVAVPETFANQLPGKSTVSFVVNAIPEKRFKARFARSARSLVEENRAMMIEFDVNNAAQELKSGMYAEVQLPIERSGRTLFVPISSVVSSSEKVFVIRVNGSRAEWVPIEKGNVVDSLVEVFGSLKAGDPVVRTASEELRDGQALSLKKQ